MLQSLITKAYAASGTPISTDTLIRNILDNILNPFLYLMVAVAVVVFLWGVLQFVRNAESPDKRKEGGEHILWGVVGFAIMVSAYGILNLVLGTIGK